MFSTPLLILFSCTGTRKLTRQHRVHEKVHQTDEVEKKIKGEHDFFGTKRMGWGGEKMRAN